MSSSDCPDNERFWDMPGCRRMACVVVVVGPLFGWELSLSGRGLRVVSDLAGCCMGPGEVQGRE